MATSDSSNNAFEKIRAVREKATEQKRVAAREPGTLSSRGHGGPIFDALMDRFETLGTQTGADPRTQDIRKHFEARLKNRAERIFATYLTDGEDGPSHSTYTEEVAEAFHHGFTLYLKVALRLDEKQAPSPHEPYRAYVQGRGLHTIRDEHDKWHYLSKYIEKGDGVTEDLNKHHDFTPTGEPGYAHAYEKAEGRTDEEAALDAYMFEKLRLYAEEFANMFEESLKRGIPYKNALEISQFVYGNDAAIYDEMAEHGINPEVVAWQSSINRARVRVGLEKYITTGKELEKLYPYTGQSWVQSPVAIRNLTLKYPQTVEQGLTIVSRELHRLRSEFPHIPQHIVIDECVASPDGYEDSLREIRDHAQGLMARFPMTPEYGGVSEGDTSVFAYYRVEGALTHFMNIISGKKIEAETKRILQSFTLALSDAEKRAGHPLHFSTRRHMLRSYLLYPHMNHNHMGRRGRQMENIYTTPLMAEAYARDSVWGPYMAQVGFGEDNTAIIENGAIVVEVAREQFGDVDAEEYLIRISELYERYITDGFEKEGGDTQALKDALFMAPYATKDAYERVLQKTWPPSFTEITPREPLE